MFLALLPLASAQVDVHGTLPAGLDADVRDPLYVRRPGHLNAGDGFVGGLLGYASRPLVVQNTETGEELTLVEDVFALDLAAGWAPSSRVRLDLELPLYGFSGQSIDQGYDTPAEAVGFGVADARVSALLMLVDPGAAEDGFGLAVVPQLVLPTGQLHTYFGQGTVSAGASLAASLPLSDLQLAGQLGLRFTPGDDTTVPRGSTVDARLAGTWMLDETLGLGADLIAAVPLYGAPGTTALPLQAVLRARYADEGGASFVGGVGFGLSDGVGVPAFRVFLGGGFGVRGGTRDRDADGIVDSLDICPDEPETPNGLEDADGCPDARPRLRIRPTLDDEPVAGVKMVLEGPVERTWTSTTQAQVLDVDPASVWKASGLLEPCLAGEAIATVADVDAELLVPLERRTIAEIDFFVVDNVGNPASGLPVRVRASHAHCAPERFELDERGQATLRLGPGDFEFVVETDELRGVVTWTAVEGESHDALLVLRPKP